MLEDETTSTANDMMVLFHEKILPNLTNNIKCGNSLIGTDILTNKLDLDLDQERKLNPFDFKMAFPKVFGSANPSRVSNPARVENARGFDAIVGNPPYVDIKALDKIDVEYYFNKYKSVENRINLYAIFIENALNKINNNGVVGYIIPNSILFQSSYLKLRDLILKNHSVEEIVKLPDNIFKDANVETVILLLNNNNKNKNCKTIIFENREKLDFLDFDKSIKNQITNSKKWDNHELKIFDIYSNEEIIKLLSKIEKTNQKLIDVCRFTLGLTPYDKAKGQTTEQIENRVYHTKEKLDENHKKLLEGSNVNRYFVSNITKEYINYGNWLGAPREQTFFLEERILIRQIISGNPLRIFAGYTTEELYNTQSIFNLIKRDKKTNLKFILAIINSSLMNFYHNYKYLDLTKNTFQKILIQNCKNFPIPKLNKSNQATHDAIVNLVEQMLVAKKQQQTAVTERDKSYLDDKCKNIDSQINDLVYELYSLTPEEIKIVEES